MSKFEIVIPGEPVPKGRPRVGRGRVYTPEKTRAYERLIREYLRAKQARPLNGPLRVTIEAYRPIPKSMSKTDKALALLEKVRPVTKPDLDNYVKSVLDGCNGILYEDDNVVCEIVARKYYSDNPRLFLKVEEIG